MLKCSKEAFAMCPTRHLCGLREDALFIEGSDCDRFNQQVRNRPITNADRIRAMSDEELAEVIMCPYGSEPDICCTKGTCLDCCEKWLRQYVEEG